MTKEGHPYLEGRYAFERLFGDLARGRRSWQSVAFLALLLNLVLTAGYIHLALQQKVVPYVVELDALGEMRAAGKLSVRDVPERAITATLRRFVHNLRTVPTDSRLLNVRLQDARSHVHSRAAKTLVTDLDRDRENLERMLERGDTRYVTEISSVLKVPGEGILYRVSWRELLRVGHEERVSAYEGYFQVRVESPEDKEVLDNNPLGIYIMDYALTEVSTL
ncbi:MAG: type IV secretion system protein [Bacteroidetes bacterium]|nr:type IV secretion system protein [Bacteroidota bacterium]